jgi:cobyrinic acid a,c-diamide synthase
VTRPKGGDIDKARTPGLIVAAPASACGKTLLTLGLLRHLTGRGIATASFKVGPDYIDAAFHSAASGRECINLDGWAMRPATLARLAGGLARDSALIVGEGVMGLFDGAPGPAAGPDGEGAPDGSTADLAARTGWPVILVIDVKGQGASAAAVLQGFAGFRQGVTIAGVVFNRVASERHQKLLTESCEAAAAGVRVLGSLPHDEALALPSRHLGLVQARENAGLDAFLDHAAKTIARHIDIEALKDLARPARIAALKADAPVPLLPPLGQRIAIARDVAFAFAYPAVIDGWRTAGAEVRPFSPLADEGPGEDADAVYLPGGYPELHAPRIAANGRFMAGLRRAAARGAAIYGECGGYMVLGAGIEDADGGRHEMAGLLALETSFALGKLHLGYRDVRLLGGGGPLGAKDARFRGHEFHYASVISEGPGESLFAATDAASRPLGETGLRAGTVMGSFIHLIDGGI